MYADLVAGIGRGVDITSYPVLSGLARIGPTTLSRLGAEIGLDRSGISRHAARLAEGGLIDRRPDPDDARGTLLTLTEDGEKTVALLRQRLAVALDRRLEGWTADEARGFVTSLERFVREQRVRDRDM